MNIIGETGVLEPYLRGMPRHEGVHPACHVIRLSVSAYSERRSGAEECIECASHVDEASRSGGHPPCEERIVFDTCVASHNCSIIVNQIRYPSGPAEFLDVPSSSLNLLAFSNATWKVSKELTV